ncbi:MAG: Asd/ArgC dimerization domain-containing protein [Candidatus Aminicenantes bacterium]
MTKNSKLRLALIGADSLRGKEVKNILTQKKFPMAGIEFYDPEVKEEYSKLTQFRDEARVIQAPEKKLLKDVNLIFLAADPGTNRDIGRWAEKNGIYAIDMEGSFGPDSGAAHIVSGINETTLKKEQHLIVNPHPVTIIMTHLIKAVSRAFGLEKAVAFILQPVSAYGERGIEELASQSADLLGSRSISKKVFKARAAFNLLSQIESTDKGGYSPHEKQISREIKSVLDQPDLPLSLSLVQAPVFHTYSLMMYVELDKKADINEMGQVFRDTPYFKYYLPSQSCPVSSSEAAGKEEILVGQIKKDEAFPNSFWLWAAADNLTRGSALNAYEIASWLAGRSNS